MQVVGGLGREVSLARLGHRARRRDGEADGAVGPRRLRHLEAHLDVVVVAHALDRGRQIAKVGELEGRLLLGPRQLLSALLVGLGAERRLRLGRLRLLTRSLLPLLLVLLRRIDLLLQLGLLTLEIGLGLLVDRLGLRLRDALRLALLLLDALLLRLGLIPRLLGRLLGLALALAHQRIDRRLAAERQPVVVRAGRRRVRLLALGARLLLLDRRRSGVVVLRIGVVVVAA